MLRGYGTTRKLEELVWHERAAASHVRAQGCGVEGRDGGNRIGFEQACFVAINAIASGGTFAARRWEIPYDMADSS